MPINLDRKKGKILRHPREVGSNEVPNFIRFVPSKVEFGKFNKDNIINEYGNAFDEGMRPGDFGRALANNADTYGAGGEITGGGIGGIIGGIADGVNGILDDVKGFLGGDGINISTAAKGLFGGAISARLNLGSLNVNSFGVQEASKTTTLPGINLYMPPGLKAELNAEYAQENMGATLPSMLEGYERVQSNTEYEKDALSQGIGKVLAGGLADFLRTNNKAAGLQQLARGRVSNSYSYAMFKGMRHRQFNYTFNLVARSQSDAKTIKDICDSFMFYMLPQKSDVLFHFYDIPYQWDIEYYRKDKKNKYIQAPNKCFLQSCNISYGDNTLGHTYNDGEPIDVTLNLGFMEIQPLFAQNQGELTNDARDYAPPGTGEYLDLGTPYDVNSNGNTV